MSVNLGRGQTLVPQQFLDTTKVSSPVQQMRGKGVPQCVRAGLLRESGSADMQFKHSADASCRESSTKPVQKDGSLQFRLC